MDPKRVKRIVNRWMFPTVRSSYMGGLENRPVLQYSRGSTVVDTTGALLVWEPKRVVPSYAVPVDDAGNTPDDADPQVAMREFHDVAMHAASRHGLSDRVWGATFRFHGALEPLPAVRPVPDGERIPLPVPDHGRFLAHDPPLWRVMEDRKSIRRHGARPIDVEQLGEFLFRVARVDSIIPIDGDSGRAYEASRRPYPSGGATYDLEFYLTIQRCDGVESGIYHYDPAGHQLIRVCDRADLVRQVVMDACVSTGMDEPPQVVVTLASRFGRLSWKYEGIAYALTLKNVGVLYQTMYLVATAMGMAPCALGRGDSAVFAQATGLDPLVESAVGEFLLGSREEE
jgi:oxazoline/thiazoline dehydrogenase